MITFNENELKFNNDGVMTPLPYFSNSTSAQLDARLTSAESSIVTHTTDISATKSMISDAWNSATTYDVGQFCIYDNKLWKCKIQHSNQTPTEGTYWTQTLIEDYLSEINTLNQFIKYGKTSGLTRLSNSTYCTAIISFFMQNVGPKIGIVTVANGVITLGAEYGGGGISNYLTYSNGLCINGTNDYYYIAIVAEPD